jgi:hypothetical protein
MTFKYYSTKDNEQKKFVESPTRPEQAAVEVFVGNAADIGGSGEAGIEFDVADGNVSAVKAIYKTVSGVALANNNVDLSQATVIGISISSATSGNSVRYKIVGRLEDSSFNFTINQPLYLDINGNITETAPTSGYRTRIGTALESGAIQIQIDEPILL